MANSNIQQWPELPANARDLRAGDVILVLRNGFPYRFRLTAREGTDTLDLVSSPQPNPHDPMTMQQVITLPSNADDYAWVELGVRIPGRGAANIDRLFIFPLEDVGGSTLLAEESAPNADDIAFMFGTSTTLTLTGVDSVSFARLRRPSSTL